IKKYEPRMATTDGRDGYEFFRRITELAPYLLVDGGALAFEVGFGQADGVRRLMSDAGVTNIYVVDDLQHVPRVVIGSCRALTRNPGPVN
ncbi:MAG: hypothetical protein WEB37_07300, partial [Bacteroidota bacterium]